MARPVSKETFKQKFQNIFRRREGAINTGATTQSKSEEFLVTPSLLKVCTDYNDKFVCLFVLFVCLDDLPVKRTQQTPIRFR